jgi:3-methylcrotonyl-CoA carboxylase beta subunit
MSIIPSHANPRDATAQQNRAQYDGLLATLRERLGAVAAGGGARHVARHHARGKMLARERVGPGGGDPHPGGGNTPRAGRGGGGG